MKLFFILLPMVVIVLLFCAIGCESSSTPPLVLPADSNSNDIPMCAYYCPTKIAIMPLTDFAESSEGRKSPKINIYVSLLDSFGIQIKYPAIFRFELYEYAVLAGDHKGKRLIIWPDFDLNDPQANQVYWQDFLRAYVFNLDFEPKNQPYILEVTCISGYGKRLSATFEL